MKITIKSPKDSITKTHKYSTVVHKDFERFKENVLILLESIKQEELEEHNKNYVMKFLEECFYKGRNCINTKKNIDLVIHKENKSDSPAVVIIEAKSPSNKTEMITINELNKKAFHELILYYLRERLDNKNFEIKNLIITNAFEWFIFDASDFEKLFYNNDFKNAYNNWTHNGFVNSKTQTFYDFTEIKLDECREEIECTYFDLREYGKTIESTDNISLLKITSLFKIFSPEYLLKKPISNDSNSLNKEFYYELLYILGLEEKNGNGKKIIQRCSEKKRQEGTILENAIRKLETEDLLDNLENPYQYGEDKQEQYFGIALELTLTWLNRILFMKLLESQLIRYNKGKENYNFLNPDKDNNFDHLNTLFFKVLNTKEDERYGYLKEKYNFIPYLNSSLFEISPLENKMFTLSGLESGLAIKLYNKTVLKDWAGYRLKGKLPIHEYLLKFLNSYNFGSTTAGEIVDEEKTLINASVLGLVFEKINGYKDGAYFTPGFITMYLASETVRPALIQKFNSKYGWKLKDITDLYNNIDKLSLTEANAIFDDLKICDPAVGSGHFLVSVLNEIIALKSELGILMDSDGKRLKDWRITVDNDELHIENIYGEFFEYNIIDGDSRRGRIFNPEIQRIQETIFEEKRKIIENSLFGVDINPNSVQICRLRLWIELLKNAYYTKDSCFKRMETLPNIDINIKCGNSLVSKYGFADAMPRKDIQALNEYKLAVSAYKETIDRIVKTELKKTIESIKTKFKGFWIPENKERMKLAEELHRLNTEKVLFEKEKDLEKRENRKRSILEKIEELNRDYQKNNGEELFSNAFEWRFEFPEVLDEEGNFTGFDIVIGNPPYGVSYSEEHKEYFKLKYEAAKTRKNGNDCENNSLKGSLDSFALFIERVFTILKNNTYTGLIVPISITSSDSMESLHHFLEQNCNLIKISSYSVRPQPVFDNAVVNASVIIYHKTFTSNTKILATKMYRKNNEMSYKTIMKNLKFIDVKEFKLKGRYPKISEKIEADILRKIFNLPYKLGDYINKNGSPIYYRTTGGRYYKVITNYSTGSTKEKPIYLKKTYSNLIGAILSSNLFFWYYQIYSNNLDLKTYELETFSIPVFKDKHIKNKINEIYKEYLKDIEKNVIIRKTEKYANIETFKEYKINKSKHIIDKIDLAIKDAYGLTDEEINFIINYDIEFRTDDEDENNQT